MAGFIIGLIISGIKGLINLVLAPLLKLIEGFRKKSLKERLRDSETENVDLTAKYEKLQADVKTEEDVQAFEKKDKEGKKKELNELFGGKK